MMGAVESHHPESISGNNVPNTVCRDLVLHRPECSNCGHWTRWAVLPCPAQTGQWRFFPVADIRSARSLGSSR